MKYKYMCVCVSSDFMRVHNLCGLADSLIHGWFSMGFFLSQVGTDKMMLAASDTTDGCPQPDNTGDSVIP